MEIRSWFSGGRASAALAAVACIMGTSGWQAPSVARPPVTAKPSPGAVTSHDFRAKGSAPSHYSQSGGNASSQALPVGTRKAGVLAVEPLSFARSPIPREQWYTMTLLGHPVGYSHNSYAPAAWHGQEGWKFLEEFHLAFGPDSGFTTRSIHYTGLDGKHLETISTRETKGESVEIHAIFSDRFIDARAVHTPHGSKTLSNTVKRVRIPIPAGVMVAHETPYEIDPKDVRTGKAVPQWTLDTDKLQLQKEIATVGDSEIVDVPTRGPVKTWKVRVHTIGDPEDYYLWVDINGEAIKLDLPLQGLDIIGTLAPQKGFVANRSYVPVWKVGKEGYLAASPMIRHPRQVNVLDLTLTGVPESLKIPADGPQTLEDRGGGQWDISIAMPGLADPDFLAALAHTMAPANGEESGGLPMLQPSVTGFPTLPESTRHILLASNPTITSGAPEIAAKARALTHFARNVEQKCLILRDWVNGQMQEDTHTAAIRTAVDILHNPRGECRDYATLYAALARSAGIPTRICVGLIYSGGGFWGHAWDESWVGEWLPVDPTMEGHFVDATHLKLAEGDSVEAMEKGSAALLSLAASPYRIKVQWIQPATAR